MVLTKREQEVLFELANGYSYTRIARRLDISMHTVKFHVGNVFEKLNVRNRTHAVTEGIRLGVIKLGQLDPIPPKEVKPEPEPSLATDHFAAVLELGQLMGV